MPDFRVTRFAAEVLGDAPVPDLRVTRLATEVLADRPPFQGDMGDTPVAQTFFLHNWAKEMRMETTFSTSISKAPITGIEDRRGLMSKPIRIITPLWSVDTFRGFRDLQWDIIRRGSQRSFFPLYQDQALLSDDTTLNFIPCDTSLRRFFIRGKAVLFGWNRGVISDVTYVTIADVSPEGITTEENLPGISGRRGMVMPIMLCEVELRQSLEFLTDGLGQIALPLHEVYGPTSLRPLATGFPFGFASYEDLPVLNISTNWAKNPRTGMQRMGKKYQQGRGEVVEAQSTRGAHVIDYDFLLETRQEAWDVIRFLETRKGRLYAFWVLGHTNLWRITAATPTKITVTAEEHFENLEDYFDYVGLEMDDGEIIIRAVDSVTNNFDVTWDINLGLFPLPGGFDVTQVKKITWAAKVRNRKDSFVETWHTDEVCSVEFGVVELLDERIVDSPDLSRSTIILTEHALLLASALAVEVTTS